MRRFFEKESQVREGEPGGRQRLGDETKTADLYHVSSDRCFFAVNKRGATRVILWEHIMLHHNLLSALRCLKRIGLLFRCVDIVELL